MFNSKEHTQQLNSSFLGDGLVRIIGVVYLFYITHILPKRVQLLLIMYVIFRLFFLISSSFISPELEGYFSSFFSSVEFNREAAFNNSFFSSAEFNIDAFNNSFDANLGMLVAGSADDVSSSNEWSANELILKASSADNGSTLGGNGSSEEPLDNGSSEEPSNLKRPRSDSSASEQPPRKKLKTEHNPSPGNESGDASPSENASPSVGNTSVGDASPSEIASDDGLSLENENSNANENASDSDSSDGLGGEVMNPYRSFSVDEIRNFSDRQLSNRISGFKGMVEADEQNNYYGDMEEHMEELRKLSNEKRRREQQRDEDARFLQEILDRINEASRRR